MKVNKLLLQRDSKKIYYCKQSDGLSDSITSLSLWLFSRKQLTENAGEDV